MTWFLINPIKIINKTCIYAITKMRKILVYLRIGLTEIYYCTSNSTSTTLHPKPSIHGYWYSHQIPATGLIRWWWLSASVRRNLPQNCLYTCGCFQLMRLPNRGTDSLKRFRGISIVCDGFANRIYDWFASTKHFFTPLSYFRKSEYSSSLANHYCLWFK